MATMRRLVSDDDVLLRFSATQEARLNAMRTANTIAMTLVQQAMADDAPDREFYVHA